jgi:hypothetical protein
MGEEAKTETTPLDKGPNQTPTTNAPEVPANKDATGRRPRNLGHSPRYKGLPPK